jgi:hypothetical protein
MKLKEIAARLTGFGAFGFSANWNPPEAQRTTAKRVISFLEDKRVLYAPESLEVPRHCIDSVLGIREMLTRELGSLPPDAELADSLRALRAAGRKFLDTIQPRQREIEQHGLSHGHWASWVFMGALGEMRGVFGVHLAIIAVRFGLPIERELASIVPGEDEADGSFAPNDLRRSPKRR